MIHINPGWNCSDFASSNNRDEHNHPLSLVTLGKKIKRIWGKNLSGTGTVILDMNAASLLISSGNIWAGNKRTHCPLFITMHLEISKGYCKGGILFTCRIAFSILLILSVAAINQHGPTQWCVSIMAMYYLLICSACGSAGAPLTLSMPLTHFRFCREPLSSFSWSLDFRTEMIAMLFSAVCSEVYLCLPKLEFPILLSRSGLCLVLR